MEPFRECVQPNVAQCSVILNPLTAERPLYPHSSRSPATQYPCFAIQLMLATLRVLRCVACSKGKIPTRTGQLIDLLLRNGAAKHKISFFDTSQKCYALQLFCSYTKCTSSDIFCDTPYCDILYFMSLTLWASLALPVTGHITRLTSVDDMAGP